MNLAVLKKTRKSPEVGDVFVMLPPDGLYLYGRVIAKDAVIGTMKNCTMIYIYQPRSKIKVAIPELFRGQLLVPPMLTNELPWKRGYFELLENRPLNPMDKLPQHCFLSIFGLPRYFDEYGNRLEGPTEPVGQYGLDSFRTIDDEISKALGITLSEEDSA